MYIDTSVQKGGIPGVPGCLEHTGVVSQLLREARENKGDLVVLWLDCANAYGSIPHKPVETALQKHHVPENIRGLIVDYYNNFQQFGSLEIPRCAKAHGKEKRHRVQEKIRAEVEEERTVRAVAMRQQGAWTKWEQVRERNITWNDLWKMHPQNIKFLIRAVYDVLPSPSNLHRWGLIEQPTCLLCGNSGTLEHILSYCPRALADGRYRWRHDQVLRVIAENICKTINDCRKSTPVRNIIPFVKEGERARQERVPRGLFYSAPDWKMEADLDKQLCFPPHIIETTLRPDIVMWSDSSKQVLMMELTVPWEERMEEAHERKRDKYEDLKSNCQSKGWQAKCWPVEVGCRGFLGQSLSKAYTALGLVGQKKSRAISTTTDAAERASRWL